MRFYLVRGHFTRRLYNCHFIVSSALHVYASLDEYINIDITSFPLFSDFR